MNNHKHQCQSIVETVLNALETLSKPVKNNSAVDRLHTVDNCEVNQSVALDIQLVETKPAFALTFALNVPCLKEDDYLSLPNTKKNG